MALGSAFNRSYIRWAAIAGGWTLLGILYCSQIYLINTRASNPVKWLNLLPNALIYWYAWALLAPFILALARRFQFGRNHWLRCITVHLCTSLIVSIIHVVMVNGAIGLVGAAYGPRADFITRVMRTISSIAFTMEVITYWMILFAGQAVAYYRSYREEELKATQLHSELVQAQLHALKMQLHPHFLFNTLHAISALVQKSPEEAEEMIARLSDLLRLTLDNAGAQEVTLKRELDFLDHYLAIEQKRFSDRLKVEMNIEPETLDAIVPNLILQPLVENAIKHGIACRPNAGRVEINASKRQDRLHLRVYDDGPGLPNGGPATLKEGIGLSNTRARVERLYGAAHQFELSNSEGGGLAVSLTIPFRTAGGGGTENGENTGRVS